MVCEGAWRKTQELVGLGISGAATAVPHGGGVTWGKVTWQVCANSKNGDSEYYVSRI